jgi:FKBP-type peptidyl-prolyl cis-trans isomerase SlyD
VIVAKDKVVSFEYTLKDSAGSVLESSEGGAPLAYLHGADNIIPALEDALDGKSAGDRLTAVIEPEDAYGLRDESLVSQVPRRQMSGIADLEVGLEIEAQTPDGPRIVCVTGIDEETVTIDANHPLAGETLHFDVAVVEVRSATIEELEHGHVHGPGGHHH